LFFPGETSKNLKPFPLEKPQKTSPHACFFSLRPFLRLACILPTQQAAVAGDGREQPLLFTPAAMDGAAEGGHLEVVR